MLERDTARSREEKLWRQVRTAYGRVENLGAALADKQAELQLLQRLSVREPMTYEPGSPHSWFLDMSRVHRSAGRSEAKTRLEAHAREIAATAEERARSRNVRAALAAERALTGTPAERRALEAFTGAGGVLFERRALTRVDGQGGYVVPPAWLVDRAVRPARADAALAAAVTTVPLPEYATRSTCLASPRAPPRAPSPATPPRPPRGTWPTHSCPAA